MEREKTKVRVVVNGLDVNPSKAEEIAIVAQLVEKFHGKQWYVSSLFSTSFLAWFEKRVGDDWSCDMQGEIEKLNEENVRETTHANSLRDVVDKMCKDHDTKISQMRDAANEVINGLRTEMDDLKDTKAEYADGLEKETTLRREVEKELRNEKMISKGREQDNITLKAKLYDLITENESLHATLEGLRDPGWKME